MTLFNTCMNTKRSNQKKLTHIRLNSSEFDGKKAEYICGQSVIDWCRKKNFAHKLLCVRLLLFVQAIRKDIYSPIYFLWFFLCLLYSYINVTISSSKSFWFSSFVTMKFYCGISHGIWLKWIFFKFEEQKKLLMFDFNWI